MRNQKNNTGVSVFFKGKQALQQLLLGLCLLFTPLADAFNQDDFQQWKLSFANWAVNQGVERRVLDQSFMPVSVDESVMKLMYHQPEFSKTIWQYLQGAVSERRIKQGRELLAKHQGLFEYLEHIYGVQPEYIVAIWGLESNYGSNYGRKNVIRSLATLAYGSERKEFYQTELLEALKLLQAGETEAHQMVGSWAGAMGHTQFMPSTLRRFGVDGDKDGRRDVWRSLHDALSSTANYLAKSGWVEHETWGVEVKLPKNFEWGLSHPTTWLTMTEWAGLGIKFATGQAIQANDRREARLFFPAGHTGPIFLTFSNFQVIKQYNNSDSYVLAVGRLGDRIRGASPLVAKWPEGMKPLSLNDKKDLQYSLTSLGYDTAGIDGKIGPNTQQAIRSWQQDIGLPTDGYVDADLIGLLRFSPDM